MTSFRLEVDPKERATGRFFARVIDELQRAVAAEKRERKLTQQKIAEILGVNRSVVNRRISGKDNLTVKSLAETAWALGYEPRFELVESKPSAGSNIMFAPPVATSSGNAPPSPVRCGVETSSATGSVVETGA